MRIQHYRKHSKGSVIDPTRTKFIVPAFALSASIWGGASLILAEFPFVNTDYYFSLKVPITVFGTDFIPAIRWVEDDIVSRFKLWDDTTAVLYYPIYDGERIGLNAVLEIWSVNSANAPTLDADEELQSSLLNFPTAATTGCNDLCTAPDESTSLVQRTPVSLPPSAYCNPFCNNLCG